MARIQFETPTRFAFATDLPLYYSHINTANHLDNAQALTLVAEARMRFFEWLGYTLPQPIEGLKTAVGDLVVQYKSEAFHGETMRVHLMPCELNTYGFDLVFRMDDVATGRVVSGGKSGIVFIDPHSKRPAPMPEAFRAKLLALGA